MILIACSIISFTVLAELPLKSSLYMPVLSDGVPISLVQTEGTGGKEFEGEHELFDSGKLRSVKTAFLLSILLPGTGELYAGNYYKAGAFFATEVALWTFFIIYNDKGNDGEDAYRVFADAHWQFEYYYSWFRGFRDDSIYTEQLPVEIHISGSDTTYTPIKNHDYYEMIGKYDWFILGWEDLPNRDAIRDSTAPLGNATDILRILKKHELNSELRLEYMNMRKEANDYFTIAKYFLGAVLFNHVLSGFDAAWTAKRANDRLYEGFSFAPSIEAQVAMDSRGKPSPKIIINIAKF